MGMFMVSWAHITEYISPYPNQLGFWVADYFGEPDTAVQPIFQVSHQDGHGRHREEGKGRHSGSETVESVGAKRTPLGGKHASDRS